MVLVIAKMKVAPIIRLSVPLLELCGTVLLAQLLHYVAKILNVPSSNVLAWRYTCVNLERLQGNMRGFIAFVGNSVAEMSEAILLSCWRHIRGNENSADCASRGIFQLN